MTTPTQKAIEELTIKNGGDLTEKRKAVFSKCELYRYSLEINWDDSKPLCQFIGLNPSTADEMKDDPTLRRVKGFARSWGYGGVVMTNLFAYRATDPREMREANEPIGRWNDGYLLEVAGRCKRTVCAWGNHGAFINRSYNVGRLLSATFLECFRLTKSKEPEHPLYMAANTPLIEFKP